MPEMLFPDNRFKSPTSYSRFGLMFACDRVVEAINGLEALLAQAKAAKLLTTHVFSANEGHPIAVNAQAVYDQVGGQNIVIYSDDACAEAAASLEAASTQLRGLLEYQNTSQPGYVPPTDSPYNTPDAPDTLDKLKPLFIAAAVVAGVVLLVPIVYEVAGFSKMFRKAKKK